MAEGDWWFDLETHQVVPDNNDTKVTDRLGPYKTREEAHARSNGSRSATRSTTTTRAGTTISTGPI